ncbi:Phosphatidate cytidylyltransferase [Babesia duncani]|uniref:phosphatidate cytidylyltransferase n=1 Tax=Babesia duncani TaxID=323732 RepID=A0AAD9PJ34_9APIC|nr:Phosphatidate cytidylyltransferase [Babesia duncani]
MTHKNETVRSYKRTPKHPVESGFERWRLGALFAGSFILIIVAGHVYCAFLVLTLVINAYYELVDLPERAHLSKDLVSDCEQTQTACSPNRSMKPARNYFFTKTLDILSFISLRTYLLLTTLSGVCLPWLLNRLIISQGNSFLMKVLPYHYLVTFILTLFGLIKFILTLESGKFKAQFLQLAMIIVSLLYVVSQSMMIIANMYFGMIWLVLPHFMIIINDTMAYLFGKAFGKHPLISISPHKTVEGFVGAAVMTILITAIATPRLVKFRPLVCQVGTFDFTPFDWLYNDCQPISIYMDHTFKLPQAIASLLRIEEIIYQPCTLHMLLLAIFASLFAPFGGFLASGFKRALKIKEFSNTIPGHGGLMDRFDCQIIMGTFTYLYLKAFVRNSKYIAESALKIIVKMPIEEQRKVLIQLVKLISE